MFADYRIVVVTPAGRERYLRLLAAHVLSSAIVDEWHLWQNTKNEADLAFMRELAAMHPRVRLVAPPVREPDGLRSIGQFFRTAIDADTIYVRMDDDVVYLEPDFFPRFLTQRLVERRPLMMFPLIINNSVCAFLLKCLELLHIPVPLTPWCMDLISWYDPAFAEAMHRWFLTRIENRSFDTLRFGNIATSLSRVSINCISWFGADLAVDGGIFPDDIDEEEYASVTLPLRRGRYNCISGSAIVAHYAFHPQREGLDATDLLGRYAEFAPPIALPLPPLVLEPASAARAPGTARSTPLASSCPSAG